MTTTRRRVLDAFNAAMDRVPRTDVRFGGRGVPAYGLGVGTGVISSAALVVGLAMAAGLRVPVATAALTCGLFTALALASATRAATGEERFTYYHYAVAVVTGVAVMLAAIGVPVLPYLDLMALGLALCLTTGRVGCLMAGCCHGRPSGWGIRYGPAHVDEGFSPHLVGVRLFPVQAFEACCVGSITLIGAAMVLRGAPSGSALAFSVVAYGVVRFLLEFLRGDCERPQLLGVPEAQWTAVLLTVVVAWADGALMLPAVPWHGAVAAALAAILLLEVVHGRWAGRPLLGLMSARDLRELAAALDRLGGASAAPELDGIAVASTSAGLLISAGRVPGAPARSHYSLSRAGGRLSASGARRFARLICHLTGSTGAIDLVRGGGGIFHVVVTGQAGRPTAAHDARAAATGSSTC
jgi:hypothetical protein